VTRTATRLPAITRPNVVTRGVSPRGDFNGMLADVAGLHVVVVDDEATNRRLCERMLKRLKCTVVCLEDGDELLGELHRCGYLPPPDAPTAAAADRDAVVSFGAGGAASACTSARFQRIDVILLDIMMRRTNGVDVAVDLRRSFRAAAAALPSRDAGTARPPRFCLPPIVAMTGNTSLQNIDTYRRAGFCHVLPKPFDVGGVLSTLVTCTLAGADGMEMPTPQSSPAKDAGRLSRSVSTLPIPVRTDAVLVPSLF
jgi:CheY-like chemotaxis protein